MLIILFGQEAGSQGGHVPYYWCFVYCGFPGRGSGHGSCVKHISGPFILDEKASNPQT